MIAVIALRGRLPRRLALLSLTSPSAARPARRLLLAGSLTAMLAAVACLPPPDPPVGALIIGE